MPSVHLKVDETMESCKKGVISRWVEDLPPSVRATTPQMFPGNCRCTRCLKKNMNASRPLLGMPQSGGIKCQNV